MIKALRSLVICQTLSMYFICELFCQAKKCLLSAEATQDLLVCFLWVLKNTDERFLRCWWSDMTPARLAQVLEVLYVCESNFEYKVLLYICWTPVVCWFAVLTKSKGKGFPYSLPSVGPGADPGVQAVSPQVTWSHPPGGRLPLLFARPAVTFPAKERHHPLLGDRGTCVKVWAACPRLLPGSGPAKIRGRDL